MRCLGCLVSMLFMCSIGFAQIPTGSWRSHFSANQFDQIVVGKDNVWLSNSTQIVSYFLDGEIQRFTLLNGLAKGAIVHSFFNKPNETLYVFHQSGVISVIDKNSKVKTINRFQNVNTIEINQVVDFGNTLFIAASEGLILFDTQQSNFIEIAKNIEPNGTFSTIKSVTIFGDQLFVSTESSLLKYNLKENLNIQDFRSWELIDDFKVGIKGQLNNIKAIQDQLFLFYTNGLHVINNTDLKIINDLNFPLTSDVKWIEEKEGILYFDNQTGIAKIENNNIATVSNSIGLNGLRFIDNKYFGIGNSSGFFQLKPDLTGIEQPIALKSISTNTIQTLHSAPDFLYAIGKQSLDIFQNNEWVNRNLNQDISTTAFNSATRSLFILDTSGKLFKVPEGDFEPTLVESFELNIAMISMTADPFGNLWFLSSGVENTNGEQAVYRFTKDEKVEKVNFNSNVISNQNRILFRTTDQSILVFNDQSNRTIINFDPTAANPNTIVVSELNGNNIQLIEEDKEGNLWVGADLGVGYFSSFESLTQENDPSIIQPIIDGGNLLKNESVNDIYIDAANRKWIATSNGLQVFSAFGEESIFNFNQENSPLPSNQILSLAMQENSGELFIYTSAGLVSYQTEVTSPKSSFENIKVFPNPINMNFDQVVTFSGLVENTIVKIADASNRVLFETIANGGTATWNLNSSSGRAVKTGVYIIYFSDFDGSQKSTQKIVVFR